MAGWSMDAYRAAKAAGANDAQAAQYAGSVAQYGGDPSEATSIVPGESYQQAILREQRQGLTIGSNANRSDGVPTAQAVLQKAGVGGGASAKPGPSALQPTYLSQLFPNGIPKTQTATANVAQVGAGPSTAGITSSILGALDPVFARGQRGLTESLANAGIVGGSTTGAQGDLAQQQQQQALSAIAPYIMQGYDMQQARDLANQSAQNQGAQFNAGSLNASNQFDIANMLKSGMYDSTLQAQQADTLAGFQNQDYLAQLGLQGNLIGSSAGAQASAYQPIFQQAAPVNYGGFASALAPTATASSPSPGGGMSPVRGATNGSGVLA